MRERSDHGWRNPHAQLHLRAASRVRSVAGCRGKSGASSNAASSYAAGKNDAALVRKGNAIAVPQTSPLRQALQVEEVAETTVMRPITLPGVTEAAPARLIKVVAPVAGLIERLHKRMGDEVRVGDPHWTLRISHRPLLIRARPRLR